MVGMGLGCLGLPFLFNGAFEAKDSHELDRGRVLSILYTGVMIVVISVWSLLNAVCIYPLKVTLDSGIDELLRTYVISWKFRQRSDMLYLEFWLLRCCV